MTTHVKRIQSVQGELEQFKKDSARKKDLESLRAEYTKLVESNHVDLLNLKAHVWGVGAFIIVSRCVESPIYDSVSQNKIFTASRKPLERRSGFDSLSYRAVSQSSSRRCNYMKETIITTSALALDLRSPTRDAQRT